MLGRSWVERDLHKGDLRVLNDIAFRRIDRPASTQVERPCDRRFLVKTGRGGSRMTLKGWIAVFLRHTFARRDWIENARRLNQIAVFLVQFA